MIDFKKLSPAIPLLCIFLYSCSEGSNLEQTLVGNDKCKNGMMTFYIPNANPNLFGNLSEEPYIILDIPCSIPKVTQCELRKEIMRDNFMTEADAKRYLRPLCE